jgi:hypothetical protein
MSHAGQIIPHEVHMPETPMELIERKGLDPCGNARIWLASQPDIQTAWKTCRRADWMLWILEEIGYEDDRSFRLIACASVRETPLADGRKVWDLLTDERSRNVVEVSERYANREATKAELDAARDAARDAAMASAWAARDAAWAASASSAAGDAAWDAAMDAQSTSSQVHSGVPPCLRSSSQLNVTLM